MCACFAFNINIFYTHLSCACDQVVGTANYQKRVRTEINRVRCLTNTDIKDTWKDTGLGLEGGPYEAKWGDQWKENIRIKLKKGQTGAICVTELMDHVVAEGNRLFADTPYKNNW